MEIKITRKQFLGKSGNCWSDYINYWLIHGRIYSDDGQYYKRFRFVAAVNFSCDGWDEETGEERQEAEILEDIIAGYLDAIRSYDNLEDFIALCNASIEDWNAYARRRF